MKLSIASFLGDIRDLSSSLLTPRHASATCGSKKKVAAQTKSAAYRSSWRLEAYLPTLLDPRG
jgi:hypothetical protein